VRDRRAAFFLLAALVCAALTPLADTDHRFVAGGLAALYLVLAVASWLDARGRG
jgi:hypothetical protein